MKLFKRKMGKKQKSALNALADGIECGAKLRPQAIAGLCKIIDSDAQLYGSCALGAAYECALMRDGKSESERIVAMRNLSDYDEILMLYGVNDRASDHEIILENEEISWEGESQTISSMIYRLNDRLGWSRERIAQFLREVE